MVEMIQAHFCLKDEQIKQFAALPSLYRDWNAKINVISRKDMDSFATHHVLHALAIAKVCDFLPNTKILDIGTGGGFPGIPLAILFPEANFTLVDSIGKKIKVVQEIVDSIGLQNVTAIHQRAEQNPDMYDFVVSRAVTRMQTFITWVEGKISQKTLKGQPLANGILYLKGGDLTEELEETGYGYQLFPISSIFEDPFFETKKVVYIPFA